MSSIEYVVLNRHPSTRDQFKDYGEFYTYYSKRGHYVATSDKGNYPLNGRIEACGNSEKEAIANYKTEIQYRLSKLKAYYESKIMENESILNAINFNLGT